MPDELRCQKCGSAMARGSLRCANGHFQKSRKVKKSRRRKSDEGSEQSSSEPIVERFLSFLDSPSGKPVLLLLGLGLLLSPIGLFFLFYGKTYNGHTTYGWVEQSVLGTDEAVRNARRELKQIGTNSVPALIWGLDHTDYNVREFSAKLLPEFGPAAHLAVPKLAALVGDLVLSVSNASRDALIKMGDATIPAAPILRNVAATSADERRESALLLLAKIRDTETLPSLMMLIKQPDPARQSVVRILGEFGHVAVEATPTLLELAKNDTLEATMRSSAVIAVCQVNDSEEVQQAMIALFQDPKSLGSLRAACIRGLGKQQAKAQKLVPMFVSALSDEQLVEAAAEVLGDIGDNRDEVIAALVQAKLNIPNFIRSQHQELDKNRQVTITRNNNTRGEVVSSNRREAEAGAETGSQNLWKAVTARWVPVERVIDTSIRRLKEKR